MQYAPNKIYIGKITEVKMFENSIASKRFEKQWEGKTLVSYSVSVKFDIFGDQWLSGFVNESKKTPGTPAVWEGMEMFFMVTEKSVEKDGETKTYYNFQKLSAAKKEKIEKDQEIANLKAQLAGQSISQEDTREVPVDAYEDLVNPNLPL